MSDTEQQRSIENLAQQATPGPWRVRNSAYFGHVDVHVPDPLYLNSQRWISALGPSLEHNQVVANAAFMAACREAVPALCAEIRLLRYFLELTLPHAEGSLRDPALLAHIHQALAESVPGEDAPCPP